MKTKIVVNNTEEKGIYIQVFDRKGSFFMGSPLSLQLPKRPSNLIYTKEADLELRHSKWEKKCKDKINTYLHKTLSYSLFGELEIIFLGFTLEKGIGVDKE